VKGNAAAEPALHAASVAVGAARKVLALAANRIKEEDVKIEAENKRVAAENLADSQQVAGPAMPKSSTPAHNTIVTSK
jgi:hypothetical protein